MRIPGLTNHGGNMVETVSRVGPLLNRTKWFKERLSLRDSLRLVTYVQSAQRRSRLGFVRRTFQTKVLDLSVAEDAIFGQFGKNTRYKIRRARREGVTCQFDGTPARFRRFYNYVAEHQGRRPIPPGLIEGVAAEVCISYALLGNTVLVMHCTLIDRQLRRARLWYSCSRHPLKDSSGLRSTIGRANRLLHFEDVRYFKSQRLAIYDFGGYSADRSDQKLMGINAFKDGFGGCLLVEANYISYPLFLAVRSRELLTGLRHRADRARWGLEPRTPAPRPKRRSSRAA